MKLTSLFATTVIASIVSISTVPFQSFNLNSLQASAAEVKIAEAPSSQAKIDQITAVKGKPGSGDLLRKLYAKDLTPIGIQPGGAGSVVNLYSKKDDTTLSLCTTFDVVVAVKKGKIAKFDPKEVK
ncbi:hypothetical protein Syn7502_00390 [Synechococcus sp. PCC 7502]|uniref:hypothetical protein n=1 Tax=Synechococcus sp. PCC 7502 TaxID=1173263 RepID=UPI00029FFFA9|nr:hypothetical protein [Synechococcus sp. PCC 7502]AFY72554.1 hypothetical protein Syn7502_00390 [Synechococcus sp. PCC 7502]